MILALAVLASLQTPSASAFFPLAPGTTWIWNEVTAGIPETVKEVAMPPITVGGKSAAYILITLPNQPSERAYFYIQGNTVYNAAYIEARPFAKPLPVLVVSGKKETWTYEGTLPLPSGDFATKQTGVSEPGKPVEAFGKTLPSYVVQIEAELTSPSGEKVRSVTKSTYVEGIGLFESEMTADTGAMKFSRKRTLTKFELPGGPK